MGGTLFALGPTRAADLAPPPWRVRMAMKINAVRYALAERIVARLGERTGGVAAAMTTGHETWIQSPDLDAMRDSGLAHILSISGLHMAVVGALSSSRRACWSRPGRGWRCVFQARRSRRSRA